MREPEGGREDGGCFYTLVSGNTKYHPFAVQASKSFLVMRAHEKEKVKLPKFLLPELQAIGFQALSLAQQQYFAMTASVCSQVGSGEAR